LADLEPSRDLDALEDHFDVDRKLAAGFQPGLDREDVRQQLSFVVGGPAAENLPVPGLRQKGGSTPLLERLRRLDVVVSIKKNRRELGSDGPMREDHRSSTRFAELSFQARLLRHLEQEAGAFPDSRILGADARLPDEGEQGGRGKPPGSVPGGPTDRQTPWFAADLFLNPSYGDGIGAGARIAPPVGWNNPENLV
jgi:hypothetical protein